MVLVVHRRKAKAKYLADILRFNNVLAYAATPPEALSEISLMYRAVIVLDPEHLPVPREFVERLRRYASTVPIFAIGDNLKDFRDLGVFDGHFKYSCFSARLVWYMAKICKKKKLPCVGEYKAGGLDATCDQKVVHYFFDELPLSKTEAMVLRVLIRAYPRPFTKFQVEKYAFKKSKPPDPQTVKTQICAINRKFRSLIDRPLIIRIPDEGYVLFTPEIKYSRNIPIDL